MNYKKNDNKCIGIVCIYFKQNKGKQDFCDATYEQCEAYKKETLNKKN